MNFVVVKLVILYLIKYCRSIFDIHHNSEIWPTIDHTGLVFAVFAARLNGTQSNGLLRVGTPNSK